MSPVDFNRRRCWRWRTLFLIVGVLLCCSWSTVESQLAAYDYPEFDCDGFDPKFKAPIMNVTAPVGREAMLTCVVEDLANYKVAWLRVDTQTILTIASHVITKNHRIGVTHSEHRTWYLHIKEVKETDRGYYMCQINTDPMKSQNGYLDVVVSPDIIDSGTSTDMLVKENDNVTLSCAATGSPTPTIQWRREDGQEIFPNSKYKSEPRGSDLVLGRVSRYHMGSYLCLASNGVPPSVSKRISLTVQFPPTIKSSSQMIGVMEGQEVTLECISEAYPKSINYWTIGDNKIVPYKDNKYVAENLDSKVPYKVHMKLTIKSVSASDFGAYKCTSRNTMGDTDNEIRLYKLPSSSGYSYNNENDAGYQGKQRKNTRNNIPGGNQDMLKEKSSNQGGRKEHGDYEDAASGAPPRLVLDCGWTLVLLLLLLRTALGSSLCSPA